MRISYIRLIKTQKGKQVNQHLTTFYPSLKEIAIR